MVVFPNAKINLGLNVLSKRADGFHAIETVLVPIPLHDVLEAVVDGQLDTNEVRMVRSGLPIPGSVEDDLCVKAVRAIQQIRSLPGLRLHLHKVIPTGAGLGGGSSDAAHMLILLNGLLSLGLSREQVMNTAASLGSDVPFFLERRPQLARGRGDILRSFELDLKGSWLLLVNPGIQVSTADAYRNCVPTGSDLGLVEFIQSTPIPQWQGRVKNDLEPNVLRTHPEVGMIKQRLLADGAMFTSMSGSGSSVFGLFDHHPPAIEWPSGHSAWTFRL